MIRPPVLETAPAALPVTVDAVKRHLRLTDDADDDLIESAIQTAVGYLDGYSGLLGRCLVEQVWRQDYDRFGREMRLPFEATSIGSITWRNKAGQMATVPAADYALQLDGLGSYARFKNGTSLPTELYEISAVSIIFTAGYGAIPAADSDDPNPVPAPIRTAITFMVSDIYRSTKDSFDKRGEDVEGVGSVQYSSPEVLARASQGTVSMLLQPFRRYVL